MPTPFQHRVHDALCRVPRGRVTTYGELGAAIGCRSAQAVGQALRRNPYAPDVPCHRVIASDLTIGGFSGERVGEEIVRKINLLRNEGVAFTDDGAARPEHLFRFDLPCDIGKTTAWLDAHWRESVLPLWFEHAPTGTGLFRTEFDDQWRYTGRNTGTLVSQSRLLYAFSRGFKATGDPRYRDVVQRGAESLERHFFDRQDGGWLTAVDRDSNVLDDRKDAYGHAFVILGLTHASRCTGDSHWAELACATWDLASKRLRDPHGGLYQRTDRAFADPAPGRSQNPVMHMVEALLALTKLTGDAAPRKGLEELLSLVLDRCARPDTRLLPELYTDDWRERPAHDGGRFDLGHQFEWAFLLRQAWRCLREPRMLQDARAFLDNGVALGVDPDDGGICSNAAPNGVPVPGTKSWWQQCEGLRAMLCFAVRDGRHDLANPIARLLAFVQQRFIDAEHGGWFTATVGPGCHNKGSLWKAGYHVTGLCTGVREEVVGGQPPKDAPREPR